jgi:hypothetical protein
MSNKIQFVWRFLDELTLAEIYKKTKITNRNEIKINRTWNNIFTDFM